MTFSKLLMHASEVDGWLIVSRTLRLFARKAQMGPGHTGLVLKCLCQFCSNRCLLVLASVSWVIARWERTYMDKRAHTHSRRYTTRDGCEVRAWIPSGDESICKFQQSGQAHALPLFFFSMKLSLACGLYGLPAWSAFCLTSAGLFGGGAQKRMERNVKMA